MHDYVPFFLGAAASGMIGGLIGARRRQTVSGVVWGFLLGPVGWLVVVLLPHRGDRCPACGGVLGKPGATKCMHCGSDLPQPAAVKVVAAPAAPAAQKRPATLPRPGKARRG